MNRLILAALAVLLAATLAGCAGGATSGNAPATKAPSKQATATTKAKVHGWQLVTSLKGTSDKHGPVFTLAGRTRLTYTVRDTSGSGMVFVSVYVVQAGHSVQAEGGIPEVTVDHPGTDSTYVDKPGGQYYLEVSAANAAWTIRIEEER